MKYYGIDKRIRGEERRNRYAKARLWVKSIIPGKHQKRYRENYEYSFVRDRSFGHDFNNGIPEGHFVKLNQIVTSDLVFREDVDRFKQGVTALFKRYGGGSRFLPFYNTSFEETSEKIERMDSTLLSWFDNLKCGVFEFHGRRIHEVVDYFTMNIRNVNTSYLSVEFRIHLTAEKRKELDDMISEDYHYRKGFAHKSLAYKKEGGTKTGYAIVYYSDEGLKADRIYEWISRVEWEFYEEIKKYIPIYLHNKGVMPPRIDVYYTDIDYRDDNRFFWNSIGVSAENGQFIDERQKMFFESYNSGRYGSVRTYLNRYIYMVKDDGIEEGQFKSVKDQVYFHMDDFSGEYFKFMFLRVLSQEAADILVSFKRRLDPIKLKKNRINKLLKLRYQFERQIDPFVRCYRDDIWDSSVSLLGHEIYKDSDIHIKNALRGRVTTYKSVSKGVCAGAKHINDEIAILRKDFDDKQQILQHLSDYRNNSRTLWINVMMLIVAIMTLFFVIFPERAEWLASIIRNLLRW